jgi:HSP20 family molecular chaperone IbpA
MRTLEWQVTGKSIRKSTVRFWTASRRSFTIPENVKPEAIHCDSKEGVLSVHIPKAEVSKQKPKQIAVQ